MRRIFVFVTLLVLTASLAQAQENKFAPAYADGTFQATAKPAAPATQKLAAKHYLNIGADPQEPGLQAGPDEEVIALDEDWCDSGFGTGSGKKVAGCYHKGGAAVRKKGTHVGVAMFGCGNRPSDRKVITGKVIAPEIIEKLVPVATPTTIDWGNLEKIIKEAVASMPPPQVTVNPKIDVHVPPPPAGKNGFWTSWKRPGPYLIIGGGILAGGFAAHHFGGNDVTVNVNINQGPTVRTCGAEPCGG